LVGKWQEGYFNTAFDITSSKVEVVPVSIANNQLARNRWFAFGLPRIAKEYKPTIVHLGFPVPIFRALFSCPVVVTVHDLYQYDFPESFSLFNGFCKRLFLKQCVQECDAVACVSERTRLSLVKRFPKLPSRVPVRLVHNYADFSSSDSTLPPIDDPRPFLLTVAQHQPNKRLGLLLLAFAQLRNSGQVRNNLLLLVVGSQGVESEALKNLSGLLQLNESVRWLPQLSDRELAWLYQSCEMFIACSQIEGFCLPMLEALSFNCRVVASDIPVFHEIAGDAPVYFDISHDPVENLTAAILCALDTLPGKTRPILRFSRECTSAECLELYSLLLPEVVAGKNRSNGTSPATCTDGTGTTSRLPARR
jgi:glycosyltransferase involved in cell wall biosynthesis